MKKICFVGGGNMATAMLTGLRQRHPALDCQIIEPFASAREKLSGPGVTVHEAANRAAIESADVIVLAVKPQVLKQVCGELLPYLRGELIVSIPNTPALIGQGITGLYAPDTLAAVDLATATELMQATGVVVRVHSDAMIDAVTAVSGSGPAYVFHWIESMLAAATGVGFNDADARVLVLATLKGATALAEASGESPAVLRERVTSRGGTTAAALAVINERGVQQALIDAVRAARDRGAELGAILDSE